MPLIGRYAMYKKKPPSDMFSQKRINRFWRKVDICDPVFCWEWQNNLSHNGYGLFGIYQAGKVKGWRAHRYAWTITNGPIPEGLNVLHHCDNRRCCNPKHLFIGTQKENIHDRDAKGRTANGEQHGHCKLTNDIVRMIKSIPRDISDAKVVKELGLICGPSNVWSIRSGRTWGHIRPKLELVPTNYLTGWLQA